MNVLSMQEIEALYSPGIGRHWFDADTKRFFRSRLATIGYQDAQGRVFFVSSEQHPHGSRLYSVRVLSGPKGRIDTIGGFQSFMSAATANRYAKGYASGNIPLPAEDIKVGTRS